MSERRPDNSNYRYLMLLMAITAGSVVVCNLRNPDMVSRLLHPQSTVGISPTPSTVLEPPKTPTLIGRDFLVPKTIVGSAEMFTSKQTVVTNMTRGIDLLIRGDVLLAVNNGSKYGINLDKDELNLTYLFPQKFSQGNNREESLAKVEDELGLVMGALRNTQGIESGKIRFSIISIGDVLENVARKNPGMDFTSERFRQLAGTELNYAYVGISRLRVRDIQQTPKIIPDVPSEIRSLLSQPSADPFSLITINPNYFIALGTTVTQ